MRFFRFRYACCVALVLLLPALSARAQDPEDRASSSALRVRTGGVSTIPGLAVPLEGPVDARTYRIGPGDVFAITVGGSPAGQVLAPVTADGQVVLPTVGAVPVAGLTLEAARDRIVTALRNYFRNGVDAALATPRTFYVHVSGAVPTAGRLPVGPVARLEDAVVRALVPSDAAARDTLRGARPRIGIGPALRSIVVEHPDGTSGTYDLLRYRRTGDLAQNPYLRDGDRIRVSAFDSLSAGVRMSGAVAFPGLYERRPEDTATRLLELADGALRPDDIRTVRVNGGAPVRLADLAGGTELPVPPGATVYVEGDRDRGRVRVEGAVQIPGAQAVQEGRTTVRDVIQAAGGLRPDALVRGAYLVRPTGGPLQPRATDLALRALRGAGDLPFVQRAALIDSSGQTLLALPGDALTGTLDVPVFDGDRLVIPRDEKTVLVSGAVARPGYVPVRMGTLASAYLEAAGGLRREAQQVYLISAGTQQLRPAEGTVPQSGDVLVVTTDDPANAPGLYSLSLQGLGYGLQERQIGLQERQLVLQERQTAIQERSERSTRRYQALSAALGAFSTAAAIVTTYLVLRYDNRNTAAASN